MIVTAQARIRLKIVAARTVAIAVLVSPFGLRSAAIAQSYPVANVALLPFPKQERQQNRDLQRLSRLTSIRLLTANASGSGTLIQRRGHVYTVLTSWHVVAFADRHTIMTPDGRRYPLLRPPQQVGNTDLAIVQFKSSVRYQLARISREPLVEGETVYAAGFPMYHPGTLTPTFDRGISAFRLTHGQVSLLLSKSLYQGYRLGYTNDIAVGMSGGPIFNQQGFLVGINGRVKYRDPDFGVYAFEDGTEPSAPLLAQMVRSSWGIPISTYLSYSVRNALPVPRLPLVTESAPIASKH